MITEEELRQHFLFIKNVKKYARGTDEAIIHIAKPARLLTSSILFDVKSETRIPFFHAAHSAPRSNSK